MEIMSDNALRPGLAEQLRLGTRAGHEAVERAGIMAAMLRGRISRPAYCRLLRHLHAIYEALEAALLRQAGHPWLQPIAFPQLARGAALAADLDFLHGPDWARAIPVGASGRRYVERLQAIGATEPELLVAHSYVRYLGDLSGGQILRRILAGAIGLDAGRGLSFYEFPDVDAKELAGRYRGALGAIDVDPDSAARIVAEARYAFGLHAELFEELAAAAAPAPDSQASRV